MALTSVQNVSHKSLTNPFHYISEIAEPRILRTAYVGLCTAQQANR